MLETVNIELTELSNHINLDANCVGTCPKCGSALFFSRLGCICRGNQEHNCTWNCEQCNPRCGSTR